LGAGSSNLIANEQPLAFNPDSVSDSITLGPKMAAIYRFATVGNTLTNPVVEINQYFADSVLQTVYSGQSASLNFNLNGVNWQQVGSVRLRASVFNAPTAPEMQLNGVPIAYTYQGGFAKQNAGGFSFAKIPLPEIANASTARLSITPLSDSAQIWSASLEISSEASVLGGSKPKTEPLLILFPNPASGKCRLLNLKTPSKAYILNATGQQLGSLMVEPNEYLTIPALPTGLYTLKVNGQGLKLVIE
jgi:hypothetical protein